MVPQPQDHTFDAWSQCSNARFKFLNRTAIWIGNIVDRYLGIEFADPAWIVLPPLQQPLDPLAVRGFHGQDQIHFSCHLPCNLARPMMGNVDADAIHGLDGMRFGLMSVEGVGAGGTYSNLLFKCIRQVVMNQSGRYWTAADVPGADRQYVKHSVLFAYRVRGCDFEV